MIQRKNRIESTTTKKKESIRFTKVNVMSSHTQNYLSAAIPIWKREKKKHIVDCKAILKSS